MTAMTRRSFAKLSALAGAAGAVGLAAHGSLTETDQAFAQSGVERVKHHTVCHNCYNNCPCWVYTEDGVAVKIEGDENGTLSKGALCTKALNQLHLVYSPRHVLHPMKRVGERGTNEWEAISWDEAVDLAATKIAEASAFGESVFVHDGRGKGAVAYEAFAEEVVARGKRERDTLRPAVAR